MDTLRICKSCNAPLPADAPQGLCPQCLLTAGLETTLVPDPEGRAPRVPLPSGEPANSGPRGAPPSRATAPASGNLRYFGDYELLDEIARGGMGVVWRARQTSLNRVVAVKMILAGRLAAAEDVKRFHTEAEAAAQLKHPNIVAIHEIGEHEGRHYYSMDFIEGKNLSQFIEGNPVTVRQAAEWLQAIAGAVQFAHQRGVLHRDLKPQNILVDAEGRPHVTDFGLAKNLQADSGVTQTGAVMGSPSYMAPEQARGRNDLVGPASDVYSLGAVLYQLLTGRAPFSAETPLETLRKVVAEEPVRPSKLNPKVSADLETVCLKCLEKDPARRYPTARVLAEDLDRFLSGEPVQARPASAVRKARIWMLRHPWAITGLISLVMLAVLGLAYGLREEAAMLRWKLTNPTKTLWQAADFFSKDLIVLLILEFFFLQALPWSFYSQMKARGQLNKARLVCFFLAGLLQAGLGLWLGDQGLRYEIWVNRFSGFNTLIWAMASFSNVWFGSTLVWRCTQHYQFLRAGVEIVGSNVSRTDTVTFNGSFRWHLFLTIEFAVCLGAVCWFYSPLENSPVRGKAVPFSILLFFWGHAWTWLIITLAGILKSRGVERTIYLPSFLLCMTVVGFGFLVFPEGFPVLPIVFLLVVGWGFGWGALRLKCLEGGALPPALVGRWQAIRRLSLRQLVIQAAALLTLLALVLVVERLRGQWLLASVKRDMESHGQVADIRRLQPIPKPNFDEFTNRFERVAKTMGNSMMWGDGHLIEVAPGKAARGSKASHPFTAYQSSFTNGLATQGPGNTNTWEMLVDRYATNQTALAELRDLLRDPPAAHSQDTVQDMREGRLPNYVKLVKAAEVLNDVVVLDLHRGDLRAVEDDLVAFSGFLRWNSQDPTLVGQMVRVACEGIGIGALWEVAQSDGWSEPQLERIQKAWQSTLPMLPEVVAAFQHERLMPLEVYDLFRQMSYREWDRHCRKLFAPWGVSPPALPAVVEAGRHYFFHPLWKFAWADQEKARYLQRSDFMFTVPRQALKRRAYANQEKEWVEQQEAANPPFAKWRFYLSLPVVDKLGHLTGVPGSVSRITFPLSPWFEKDFSLPNFSKALNTATRNEVLREMAVTSLALKRYALRHGRLPDQLAALVPEFLPEVPIDWWDGKPLRYRLNTGGTYLLYAVGWDGKDDGGIPTIKFRLDSPGDQVWPQAVPWEPITTRQ